MTDDTNSESDGEYPAPPNTLIDARFKGLCAKSSYCDIEDLNSTIDTFRLSQYCALHLNIHSLPSKYSHLRNIIDEVKGNGITIHFILLCETFLTEANSAMFPIPGYCFVHCSRSSLTRGGVAMYIHDSFNFSVREDLSQY